MNPGDPTVMLVAGEQRDQAFLQAKLVRATGGQCVIEQSHDVASLAKTLAREPVELCCILLSPDLGELSETMLSSVAEIRSTAFLFILPQESDELAAISLAQLQAALPPTAECRTLGELRDSDLIRLLALGAHLREFTESLSWSAESGRLVTDIARKFIAVDSSHIETAIDSVLQRLGLLLKVDRVYVYLFSAQNNTMIKSHEWCARGIPSQKHRSINSPLSRFRWFADKICNRHVVRLDTVVDLPQEAAAEREAFAHENIKAVLCVPLVHKRHSLGFFGISSVRCARSWTDAEVELLTSIGKLAVNALIRRDAELAIRESERKFRNILDSLNDGVLISDSSGRIDFVNQRFAELAGLEQAAVVGQVVEAVLPPTLRAAATAQSGNGQFGQSLAGGLTANTHGASSETAIDAGGQAEPAESKVSEVQITGIDGNSQWLEVKSGSFRAGEGETLGTINAFADVTKRKNLEQQLLQSQKMEAVGRLAGGVAHDFNNLLTAVLGYSGLLLARLAPENPIRREILQIRTASERAGALVQQLLTFSRKQTVQPKVFEINAIVEETGNLLTRLIGEDIEFVVKLSGEAGAVFADPGQVQQVILNLAINSRDAMPDGGHLTIRTSHADISGETAPLPFALLPGSYAVIEVSDTGSGIPEEYKSRLFDPFFTTKEPGKGTGLGLSTVYGIVQNCGGKIEVESKVGHGTRFRVFIPHATGMLTTKTALQVERAKLVGDETILLVEDEDGVRNLLKEVLEMHGYKVLAARHGVQAMRLSERHSGKIDLLVTDVVMPFLGGKQLTEQIVAMRPSVKVLIISGYREHWEVPIGLAMQNYHFLSKPFPPYEFLATVRALLDGLTAGPREAGEPDSAGGWKETVQ